MILNVLNVKMPEGLSLFNMVVKHTAIGDRAFVL